MIDISEGVEGLTNEDVVNIDFNDFDSQIDELREQGVRIFGYNASVSRDFEPEYITVSEDSKKAWVSLQENNALAAIDLETMTVTGIIPLGLKNHSLPENSLDFSDRNDEIFMSTWEHLKGMYLPDAISSYTVDGVTYVVTANEGDQREFDPIDEDVSVKDDIIVLDPDIFPNGELVYDSGNDFEKITAFDPVYGEIFNASNSNNNFKNRSDNKGPEPEGVTVAEIHDKYYAFITLERIGGVMVYDITDPASPVFVDYNNNRTLGEDEGGDLGPEGIIYINPKDSPIGMGLIVMANEVSSTISVYYIKNDLKNGKGHLKNAIV